MPKERHRIVGEAFNTSSSFFTSYSITRLHSRRDSNRVLKYLDERETVSQGYGVTLRAECRRKMLLIRFIGKFSTFMITVPKLLHIIIELCRQRPTSSVRIAKAVNLFR